MRLSYTAGFRKLGGVKLHFHQMGQGTPLILLHGLLGSSVNWLGVGRALAAHFTVFALDQRNHGRSPHAPDMSYPAMAADVAEFCDAQGLASVHVVGHSMGGKVAMQFALNNPARVKRLIVVDISPRSSPPEHRNILEAMLALKPESCRSREALDAALAEQIPDGSLRRFLLKNVAPTDAGTLRWQINLPALHASYGRLTEALSGGRPFQRPTLFLKAEHSDYLTEGDEPLIWRLFPEATLQVVTGAGHWIHSDAPTDFTKRVVAFLSNG